MRTFAIATLGCKVNHYESEQIATVLRSFGLTRVESGPADLRVVNTCSVTVDAASKSRQTVRRSTRLAVLQPAAAIPEDVETDGKRSRVIVTGCWATSDTQAARAMPGVDAVLTHHEDVAAQLRKVLAEWRGSSGPLAQVPVGEGGGEGDFELPEPIEIQNHPNPLPDYRERGLGGTRALPLLNERQSQHQRAFLKIQDGCDAHCTYCIIPNLRPSLWSKPVEDVLREARALVDAGHVELVLTGIFLSAYGQATALRRRQSPGAPSALGELVEKLCTSVPGLKRLRLSSLEPGDLNDELVAVLHEHWQVVPHFHLPLQSGSDVLLRQMNRQYRRDDFLRMIDRVHAAFDRPALTTDIIVGFPGETDEEFDRTLEIVEAARFIHIHAFPFSPRPGTAAARWTDRFVRGPIVSQRIHRLEQLASAHSVKFREQFIGQQVQLLVEREHENQSDSRQHHGRCERYFDVHFESDMVTTGDLVTVTVDRVSPARTFGTLSAACHA